MNATLTSIQHLNWRILLVLLTMFLAGYVTRVVIETLKPIWKDHKQLQKKLKLDTAVREVQRAAAENRAPDQRSKLTIASAILEAEEKAKGRATNR